MTEAKIKEEISLHLFGVLAASKGYATHLPRVDEGEDILLRTAKIISFGNRVRHSTSGKVVGIQMKTTTENQVVHKDGNIGYRLDIKNYNDLILRKNEWTLGENKGAPLMLVLHVLPDEPSEWVIFGTEENFYKVNGCFYWFFPAQEDEFSKRKPKHTIWVSSSSQVDAGFFDNLFNLNF